MWGITRTTHPEVHSACALLLGALYYPSTRASFGLSLRPSFCCARLLAPRHRLRKLAPPACPPGVYAHWGAHRKPRPQNPPTKPISDTGGLGTQPGPQPRCSGPSGGVAGVIAAFKRARPSQTHLSRPPSPGYFAPGLEIGGPFIAFLTKKNSQK